MKRLILSLAVLCVLSTGIAGTAKGVSTSTKKISPSNGGEALEGSNSSSARQKAAPSNGGKALSGSNSSSARQKAAPSNGGEALKGSK